MDDYITRQWLLDEYDKRHKGPPGGARKMIEEAPAADVRPVVLCRDCRYSEKGDKDFLYCNTWDAWNVPTDGFCSFGERDKTESNAPRLKRPDPCADCRWSPPSSGDGKPCCACDPDDPLMNCYERSDDT